MPTYPPKPDPGDFAQRLREAMEDCGLNTGRGAGTSLARRYGTSVVTANAWLKGEHRPDTDRAKRMAEDFGVRFEWLYFGTGPKVNGVQIAETARPYIVDKVPLTPDEIRRVRLYREADLESRTLIDRILDMVEKRRNERHRRRTGTQHK